MTTSQRTRQPVSTVRLVIIGNAAVLVVAVFAPLTKRRDRIRS